MKKKRFIPLLLAVSLSSSVLGFAAPTQEESVSEVSTSSSSLSEDFTSENEASLINNPEAEESADISTMRAAEDHFSGEDVPPEEDGIYPSTDALFAFEGITNKDEFYAYFNKVLDPLEVPEYLGEEKYYRADNPAVYGLDPQNPSRQILNIITKALRENIDTNISDDAAYGGILPFREAGGNMTPVGIRFKKFDNGEKLAYVVWQLNGEGPKVLIPLKGTAIQTFSFFVNGNVNLFNLPRNKAICDHNMGDRKSVV